MHRDAMLVPIQMGTNTMATGNQQKHLSQSFAVTKV